MGLTIVLTGCWVFVPGVHDLTFVGVQAVNYGQLRLHDVDLLEQPYSPERLAGKIEVASKVDAHKIAMESELNIWPELTICNTGAKVAARIHVYFKGTEVNYASMTPQLQKLYHDFSAQEPDRTRFIYEIYFDPKSDLSEAKDVNGGHPDLWQPYDLTRAPVNLCLRIGGGNMMGGYFVSNEVVIPAASIGYAFRVDGRARAGTSARQER